MSFSSSLDGWAVGDNGVIAGTHDRGLSWFVVQPAVAGGQNLRSVWRATQMRAVAVGAVGVAPRTWAPPADSIQWKLENAGAALQLAGVSFGDSLVYAAGSTGGVGAIVRSEERAQRRVLRGRAARLGGGEQRHHPPHRARRPPVATPPGLAARAC